jgi:folate-binding protein YgfZ
LRVGGVNAAALEGGRIGAYVRLASSSSGEERMPMAHLADRAVVHVSGPDAKTFLDGLVTCDLDKVTDGRARLGALLTPQGKILFDFLVVEAPEEIGGGYLLDASGPYVPDLVKRLTFYKLRAKVTLADLSDGLTVVAGWDVPPIGEEFGVVFEDPRLGELGWRAIVAKTDAAELAGDDSDAWRTRRIALGVPDGGRDFMYGDAFPHEALMDQLSGVDFDKGCYVGQEVVSRMQHRGTARTRLAPLVYVDGIAPEAGSPVTAGEKTLGTTGTASGGRGLAMLRLDRVADAMEAGDALLAGGLAARLEKPSFIRFPFPGEPAKSG